MPRSARTVAVGCAHHITQRGNNGQDVFFVDDDRRVYLELLAEQAEKYGLEILGYCLMTNHVHLVAVPKTEGSLAKAVGRTHFSLRAAHQPLPQTQRAPVAGAVQFLCAGYAALPVGDEVHRAPSRACAVVPQTLAIRMAQCGCAC